MLEIARDPEHQDLTCDYSGCAVRHRSACNGRPASHDLGDVSAVCTIKEAKWKPIRLSKGGGIPEMRDRSGERKVSLSRD